MSSPNNLGIFTTDIELVIRSWDDWLARVTGISANVAVGKKLTELVSDLQTRHLDVFFQRSLEEGVIEILAPRFHHYLISCPPLIPSRRFQQMQQKVTIAPLQVDAVTIGLIVTIEDTTEQADRKHDETLVETFDQSNWTRRREAVCQMTRQGRQEAVSSLLRVLREQHRNLNVLNSALRVLTASGLDTTNPLIELLKDQDHEVRMYGALALGDLKSRAAVPALVELLRDPDSNVRFHAIEALTKIKAPEAASELLEIAQSGDFFLAFPAIDALARLDDPQIAVRLVPLLADEMVRTAVVDALGNLGDEHVIAPMMALLDRPGPHVNAVAQAVSDLHDRYERQFGEGAHIADLIRKHAPGGAARVVMEALDQAQTYRLRGLVRLLSWIDSGDQAESLTRLLGSDEVRKEVIEALVRHGRNVAPALVRELVSESADVRRAAILALGRIGDPMAVPGLVRILTEDRELGISAAAALAKIGDSRAYDALIALLGHVNPAVRQAAIAAINSLGDARTESDVKRLIADPNAHVRESAVRICGYFGYADCAGLLLELVDDVDEGVRRAAIESLPYLDDPNVVDMLVRLSHDRSAKIRAAAAQALGSVEGHEAIRNLIAALNDEDSWVRYYATRSLGRIGTSEGFDGLRARLKSDPAIPVRIAAAEALAAIGGAKAASALSSVLNSGEQDLARAAAQALGHIGHPDALPPLLDQLRSDNPNRRLDAIRALGARTDREVVEALEWIAASDRDPLVSTSAIDQLAAADTPLAVASIVRLTAQPLLREKCIAALSRIDNKYLEAIAAGLRHPQFEVRRAVVEALSRKKHPDASELLAKALDDEQPSVRLAAVSALSRLGSQTAERKLTLMMSHDPDVNVRIAANKALER